jgi:hypothetical protein
LVDAIGKPVNAAVKVALGADQHAEVIHEK